jgi:hypothetical protein
MRDVDLLASPFAGVMCRGHALTCTPLCHEGGRCVRWNFRSEGVRWHSCHHPRCCGAMNVVVGEWVMSSQVDVHVALLTVHGHVHVDGASTIVGGPPWLPVLPKGSTCPSSEVKTHRGGSGAFDDATRARARRRDVTRDAYRARGLSARLGRDRVCRSHLERLTCC